MKALGKTGKFAIFLVGLLWLILVLKAPTLDFDESLYRSVTESMRRSGNPWNLTWDGIPLFHKPPIFYWLIWAASSLTDYGKTTVSSLASRIPSLLSTTGILISLYFGSGRKWTPPLAFLCALFPVLTGAAVIFDPLQTLALMPALFIPLKLFKKEKDLNSKDHLLIALSMGFASAVKGLNGLLIPAIAFALHLIAYLRFWSFRKIFYTGMKFLFFSVFPAALLAAGFYWLLDRQIGPNFTHEFIWVQHFGRSSNAMEAHSGGILYYPLILFFGGGFLMPFLIYRTYSRGLDYRKYGYPLTFAISCVLLFSLSATKLPHYAWPAWAALAIFAGMMAEKSVSPKEARVLSRRIGFLAALPVFFLGVLFLLLGTSPGLLFDSLPKSPAVESYLTHLPPFTFLQQSCFVLGALSCFVFQVRRKEIVQNIELTALFASISSLALGTGLLPTVQALMVTPFQEIATSLKSRHPAPTDCIRHTGALSATLGLALAPELVHNRCEPNTAKFKIVPDWKNQECLEPGYQILDKKSYLILCEKITEQGG